MPHPWLILGGLYAWDRLNRQSREAQENARRLAELEKIVNGEQDEKQPVVTVGGGDESGGCLAVLGCLKAEQLRKKLLKEVKLELDNLRVYRLTEPRERNVEQYGTTRTVFFDEETLVV
ncbi:MAG: CRISPR-associated endonuclease Cas2 [Trichlorobacter sp.]|uniref:CRISPR-associated endonuclease Cas2 n=1 Tax=Trichlorobacter sp. TaxID=2911007 RepID=UPI002563CD0C|nr:CRISPR-associated endonuclease Cas2 [Trichlorobacter sp.]MDK9719541.1 CRISPR-associated endonuclease Cas2 [Trichlorobacter sp.]